MSNKIGKAIFILSSILNASASEIEDNSHQLLTETYGKFDLASKPAFQGGFINFGYWKGLINDNDSEISVEKRIKASEALYDLVIDSLGIESEDRILEIGAGRGYGCAKIAATFNPSQITGMDITPEQTERSKEIHNKIISEYPSLSFITGSATNIPTDSMIYNKLYSVEAAQCFTSMTEFAREAWRVLDANGRIAITAHFSTNESGYNELRKLIPTIDQGVDRLIPIDEVRLALSNQGFQEVQFKKIGQHVFKYFDRWVSQIEDVKWSRNLLLAYEKGYIDYYLIVSEKR